MTTRTLTNRDLQVSIRRDRSTTEYLEVTGIKKYYFKSFPRDVQKEIDSIIGNRYSRFTNKMDRFWLMGFFEDGHRGRLTRHLHLLHYIPYDQVNVKGSKSFQRNMVKNQFQFLWSSIPHTTHLNENRPVCPIYIQTISTRKDSVSVSRYSSKELHRTRNYDHFFFSF